MVVAAVPVQELAVGLRRGRTDMFTVATLHEDRMYDESSTIGKLFFFFPM